MAHYWEPRCINFFASHSRTGGPRYLRTFYLRIRLFILEKMVRNDKFSVKNGLIIYEFKIRGPNDGMYLPRITRETSIANRCSRMFQKARLHVWSAFYALLSIFDEPTLINQTNKTLLYTEKVNTVKLGYNELLGNGHFCSLKSGLVIIGLICELIWPIWPKISSLLPSVR
jgi:hypothetical protein